MPLIAERAAGFTAIPSAELPLSAIASVLDSAKAVANAIIETFMVILP
jgi:hypothetical protein